MAHPLHEQVRHACGCRCGYCRVTETAVGAELTVDHYQPRAAGGNDALENLVYACHRCNLYKGDYWPTPEEVAAGQFVLHPRRDDSAQHLRENEMTGEFEPLTATGAFNIRLLHLNRPQLIAHRLAQRAAYTWQQRLQLLEEHLQQREETISFLHAYIDFLTRLLATKSSSEE